MQYYTDYTILAPIGKPSGTFAGRACSPKDLNGSLNALANMEATHVLLRKSSGKIRSQWNCGRRVPLRYCACKRFGCAAAGAKDSCFRIGRHECVARNVTGFTRLNVFPLLKSIESNSMKMDVRATHDQTPTQCAVQTPCCGSKVTLKLLHIKLHIDTNSGLFDLFGALLPCSSNLLPLYGSLSPSHDPADPPPFFVAVE